MQADYCVLCWKMPVETRSRAKRFKREHLGHAPVNPHWNQGASQVSEAVDLVVATVLIVLTKLGECLQFSIRHMTTSMVCTSVSCVVWLWAFRFSCHQVMLFSIPLSLIV